jgi:hypothetical protein
MFYAGENRSERISTKRRMSQKTYSSRFRKRETPRFCKTQKKSPTVPEAGTHFWKTTRSLLGSPPATFVIFVAETWVVIQVGASK